MKKRSLSLFMAVLMILSMLQAPAMAAAPNGFTDVGTDHWAYGYIQDVVSNGFFDGTGTTTFSPGDPMTRGMFVTVLARFANAAIDNNKATKFSDVPSGQYYTGAVAWGVEIGIIEGKSASIFGTNDQITREDMFVLFIRLLDYCEVTLPQTGTWVDFKDADQISAYARDAMERAVKAGMITGYEDGSILPKASSTRAEVAALVSRCYKQTGDVKLPAPKNEEPSKPSVPSAPGGTDTSTGIISANDAIKSIFAIGFVDNDGAKISAIAIEYSVKVLASSVSLGDYEVINYGLLKDTNPDLGEYAGKPLNIYVNGEAAVSPTGGTSSGKYVIIEVNTDYQRPSTINYNTHKQAMAAGVVQKKSIAYSGGTVTASTTYFNNYGADAIGAEVSDATDGSYILENIAGYQLFTLDQNDGNGDAFHAENCWEEAGGKYVDVDLPYSLYVPDDYSDTKEYALVIQIPSAGGVGDNPLIALNNDQGPANFASKEVQELVKPELGGIIVLVPQVPSALRATRDDASLSAAIPAIWKLVDKLTDDYSIDMDRIYGEGESMGGMTLLAMAAQRDNYFAGIWANGCQWWSNYNLEDPTYNNGTPYAPAPADGTIIWETDWEGNDADYRNMYYMLSDDNILITNCVGDNFSSGAWRELWFLYYDLAGVEIPRIQFNPIDPSYTKENQNDALRDMFAAGEADANYTRGFYWYAFDGGNHNATWLYSHAIFASYEWLLGQSREEQNDRDKLDLDKPFEEAVTPGAEVVNGINRTGSGNETLLTGKYGSGTAGYNSALFGNGGNGLRRDHAWVAADYAASVVGSGRPASYDYYATIQDAVDAVKNSDADFTINILRTDKDTSDITVDGTGTGSITIRDTRLPESFFIEHYDSSDNRIYKTPFTFGFDVTHENVTLELPADVALELSADAAVKDVTTLGFVDFDGAKVSAIVVEYGIELTAGDVDKDLYTISNYGIEQGDGKCELGEDPGKAVKAYVSETAEIDPEGVGDANGKYVIIEVNTDYQLGSAAQTYLWAMYAGVVQTGDITAGNWTITASATEFKNYDVFKRESINQTTGEPRPTEYRNYALKEKFTIEGTEVFELHTIGDEAYPAFHAVDCWDEATGEDGVADVDLPYALYVPEDYDEQVAAGKKFALVLHIHDAGSLGDDPMNTLTKARGPVNYASAEVQQILKDQGLGGLIVVAPSVPTDLRSTRDDYSLSAAVPATWQLMDYLTEEYEIDENRIYGTGQSMGGMQVVAMAAQRDNYFAGILPIGSQWGANHNLDDPTYNGVPYYEAPADGTIIWTVDSDGNAVDYRNMYYLLSDDNILVLNCKNDSFSYGVWTEFKYLYLDLAGAEIPCADWNPLTNTVEDQSDVLRALVAQQNDLGIYWGAFEGGNHNATWVYAHRVSAAYEWLFEQTRATEMSRDKLELDKPFVAADEQIQDSDRWIEEDIYLVTGKLGAGTADYNAALHGKNGGPLVKLPGWKPGDVPIG